MGPELPRTALQLLRLPLAASIVAAVAACAASGAKDFEIGQALQGQGDTAAAHAAFVRAAEAAPDNPAYRQALEATGAELAVGVTDRALGHERIGDWGAAAEAWAEAAELVPSEPDYPARAALANAKAAEPGVIEWYQAVQVVAEEHPDSGAARTSLEQARGEAYQFHLALGREALARRAGAEALEHFTAARELDPATPGLSLDDFDEAQARKLAEDAEKKAAAGDAIGAYETYRAAYAKKPLPDVERAMKGVKARAAAVLAKLDRARDLAEKRRFESALRIYDQLLDSGKAPESVVDEAAAVREDLVRESAEDARRYADRGDLRRSLKALNGLVGHVDLDPAGRQQLQAGIALIGEGAPADAVQAVDKAGLPADSPVHGAVKAAALAEARRQVKSARRIARGNGAKAVTMLARLSSFEEELPEIGTLRRSLRADAFEGLLDEAVSAARKGNDLEAAAALQAALEAGEAPDTLRGPVEEGIAALKAKNYADAERAFRVGLAAVPRSRLAREGARVAELRRVDAEKAALAALRAKSPRSDEAVDVLAASFELSPASGAVREGRALLEDRLEASAGLSNADAAAAVGWLARLSEIDQATRVKVEEAADLLEAGRFEAAESTFAAAGAHPVAQRGQQIARARLVGGLEAQAEAGAATPAAADAIAALLARDPSDPAALGSLERLLAQAEASAAAGNDAEAARLLGLATRATRADRSNAQVESALTEGHAALKSGDVGSAAAAYAKATALAPDDRVAGRAAGLASKLDAAALSSAIRSGGFAEASAALKRTLERDPSSSDAQAAMGKLLTQAEDAVRAGKLAEAAQLYEVANVATRPDALRAAVTAANTLIGQQKLVEALAAYDEALKQGESKVATEARSVIGRARTEKLLISARTLQAGTGEDLERAALEVRTLLKNDPTSEEGRAAVTATLDRAQTAADNGDAEGVARGLTLAAIALGQSSVARRPITLVRQGKLGDAEGAFTQTAGALLERGPPVVVSLRLQTLKTGLSSGGLEAARSIRDLLRANPNDPTARKAFDDLVAKIGRSAESGAGAAAAAAIREANIASGAGAALSAAVMAGAAPLEESRFADAEAIYVKARSDHPKSEVLGAAISAARALRAAAEAEAIAGIASAEDPRVYADRLLASRAVDPDAPALERGMKAALERAKAAAGAGDATLLARSLAAAGRLEAATAEGAVAMNEAAELVAKGQLASAEEAYAELRGETAEAARARVRDLRVLQARAEVDKMAKAGDLLGEAAAVRALLALAPNDRDALARTRRLAGEVKSSRVDAAKQQIALGKPGVAWLYLDRALTLDPTDKRAQAMKAEVEKDLGRRKDLILVVEAPRRDGVARGTCTKVDPALQAGMMEALSKRTDLGGYVLSEGWTKAWREGDERAPDVNGGLSLVLKSCVAGSGSGKLTFTWSVDSPKGGKAAATGEVTAEVEPGSLLVDERDGQGNNVRRLLVNQSVAGVVDGMKGQGSMVKQWLLAAAEHALAESKPEDAADAYARYRMNPVRSADPSRAQAVEVALNKAFP